MSDDGDPGGGPPNSNTLESETQNTLHVSQNKNTPNTFQSNEKQLVLYKTDMKCDLYKLIVQLKPNSPARFIKGLLLSKLLSEITDKSSAIVECKRLSRNKYLVSCLSSKCANAIIQNETLQKEYSAYIPLTYVSCTAIIRDVDLEISDEELSENIDCGDFKLTSIQRLNRKTYVDGKVIYVPSTTCKVVFEGQDMPGFIYLWYTKVYCEPYVQNPVQCFSCFQFGHITKYCKNVKVCKQCYQKEDVNHMCNLSELKCINCNGPHNANSKFCPEYERQKSIKLLMSTRNLCFPEANSLIPALKNTFSVRTKNSFGILENLENSTSNDPNIEFPQLKNNKPTKNRHFTKYVPPPINMNKRTKRKPEEMSAYEIKTESKKNKHLTDMQAISQLSKSETYYQGNEISKLIYKGCEENKKEKANHEELQWSKLMQPNINFTQDANEDVPMSGGKSSQHSFANVNINTNNADFMRVDYDPRSPHLA